MLVGRLGLTQLFDTQKTIPKEVFGQDIRSACHTLALLRGVKARPLTGKDEQKVTKDMLNRELRAMFACSLVGKRKRVGNREKAVFYKLQLDKKIHDLADRSDYFTEDSDDIDLAWAKKCDEDAGGR